MNKKLVIIISVLFLLLVNISALCDEVAADKEEKTFLSLDKCIKFALKNNLGLKISSYDLEISKEGKVQADAVFDPEITLSHSYSNAESPTSNPYISGATFLKSIRNSEGITVSKLFSTGTVFEFYVDMGRSKSNSSWADPNPAWSASTGININQPLLKKGWMSYNLADSKTAEYNIKIAYSSYSSDVSSCILSTQEAYWNYLNSQYQLTVKKKEIEYTRQLLEVNRAKAETGAISSVEVLQAEASLATREEELLSAEKNVYDTLDELLNIIDPLNKDIPVQHSVPEFIICTDSTSKEIDLSIDNSLIDFALTNRPEVFLLTEELAINQIQLLKAKNELLPALDLDANIEYSGLGASFSDTTDEIFSGNYNTWNFGLSFSYPFGNRANESAYRQEVISLRKSLLELEQTKKEIELAVKKGIRAVKIYQKTVIAAKKSLALAKKQLEAELERQKYGQATTFNVLEFQRQYADAESSYKNAQVNLQIAVAQLKNTIGLIYIGFASQEENN